MENFDELDLDKLDGLDPKALDEILEKLTEDKSTVTLTCGDVDYLLHTMGWCDTEVLTFWCLAKDYGDYTPQRKRDKSSRA